MHSESIIIVEGLPMKNYLENVITGTIASKAGQVLDISLSLTQVIVTN